MQIDWFTLVAQIVNFLILVGLLWRFLYGPIIRAMSEREARIAARLRDAARVREEAEREALAYHEKNRDIEARRKELLTHAREEAEARRLALLDEARQEVELQRAGWREALRREQEAFLGELRRKTGEQLLAVARRALADLADEDLERQVLDVFLRRLQALGPAIRGTMAEAIRDAGEAVICTAFPLPASEQERLTRAIQEELADGAEVRFEVLPDLLCGIELRSHSHRLGWNLGTYLEAIEEDFLRAIEDHAGDNRLTLRETDGRAEPIDSRGG
jgi:F-type H+-transporting ATPase subunit b